MPTEMTESSRQIIRAVKAELKRRDLDGIDLVHPLGLGRNAVYSRLRFERPFDTDELAKIVAFLGIDFATLFASVEPVALKAVA